MIAKSLTVRAFAVSAAVVALAMPAAAELAVSVNDNKVVLVNGVATTVQNPTPDTVTIIDLSAKPPKWDPLESTCRHASLSIL